MAAPAAPAMTAAVIVFEVRLVRPDTVSVALTRGACVATVTGASVVDAVLPAASVATAVKA